MLHEITCYNCVNIENYCNNARQIILYNMYKLYQIMFIDKL